jgi:hypothetical protein
MILESDKELLPIGTRIVFLKTLDQGPNEDSPAIVFAEKGDGGCVTGHGCKERYWVKWDKWQAPFGAIHGTEFEASKS